MTKDEAESYIGKTVYSHDGKRVVAYEIASVRNARTTYSRHYDESWKLVTKEGQTIYFTTFPTKTEALEKWVLRLIERIHDNKNEIRAIELELDKNLKLLDLAQAALNAEKAVKS